MATLRQKKAFDKALENGGNVSKAMSESDFSPAMAKNPQKLTRSKGWQELMDKYLPEEKLAKIHKQVLEKKEILLVSDGKEGSHLEYTGQPHPDVVKGLDMAFKLRGSYAPEKSINLNLDAEELRAKIKQEIESFKNTK